ncbi:MAG: peptidylprolyl isomerase [Chitinophagales bacterium]|nr:peptidylprolyl isomerase [Chitinophagales bacterium]MDW8427270.1 peptidylprolyl isomerase [Chitinophagales bacterium]
MAAWLAHDCFLEQLSAQPVLVDKVVAIVNDRIILWSDVEQAYLQLAEHPAGSDIDELRCRLLDQMMIEKLLVRQAEIDSIIISDDQVEQELDQRIRYFSAMVGSQEKLEAYYGKSILELKEEFRDQIRERQMADRMRSTIVEGIKVTPSEVAAYFYGLPADSLPYFNTEVEVMQLVIYPKVNDLVKSYARSRAEELLARVKKGEDFAALARTYSKDPASAEQGGDLGFVSRGELDPSVEAAAFALKNPFEVSNVVESRYGFHIIQLLERRGGRIRIRHILIKPEITTYDIARASRLVDSIYGLLRHGVYSFERAVGLFSEDEQSRSNGGLLINPTTQSSWFELTDLAAMDPALVPALDTLQQGQFTTPMLFRNRQGESGFRILYLKSRKPPHQANLRDDFERIQHMALAHKQMQVVELWLAERIAETYIYLSPEYKTCSVLQKWNRRTQQ